MGGGAGKEAVNVFTPFLAQRVATVFRACNYLRAAVKQSRNATDSLVVGSRSAAPLSSSVVSALVQFNQTQDERQALRVLKGE